MGHLFRMLTLGEELRNQGDKVLFAINPDDAPASVLQSRNFPFITQDLSASSGWEKQIIKKRHVDIWVDDCLETTREHTEEVQQSGAKVVTFDNFGSGVADADLHIASLPAFYEQHPVQGKKVLKGVEWLILNPLAGKLRRHRTAGRKRAVCLGGSDTYGVTVKVASLLHDHDLEATYFVGPAFQSLGELAAIIPATRIRHNVPSLIEELAEFDYAITGGGIVAFEAAAMGLPTVTVANERHEVFNALFLEGLGCSLFSGYYQEMRDDVILDDLDIGRMSSASLEFTKRDTLRNLVREIRQA